MDVKKLGNMELIDESYIRTTISDGESVAIVNKNRVFRATNKHFTKVNERVDENMPNMKELYYEISIDDGRELPLDSFRLMATDPAGKQMILDGIMELLLLISEGKIYDVELNPLNFIAEDNHDVGKVYVKAFYRRDRGLREITNEWLEDAKKLIGYFLVSDTGISERNYENLSAVDIYHRLSGSIAQQYLKILKSPSIDKMARDWFTDEAYRQIKGFPPIVSEYVEPKDVTSVSGTMIGNFEIEEDEGEEEELDVIAEDDTEGVKRKEKHEGISKLKTLLIGVVLLVGLVMGILMGTKYFNDRIDMVEVPVSYYNGMLKASVQKYKDAAEDFDLLTFEELELLGEDEKTTIYITYLKGGNFDRALAIDPEGAETVVTYLEKRDELPQVLDMESELAPIKFERAYLEEDYQTVVDLKGEIRDTERRQLYLVESLVKTGNIETAVEYVEEKGLEGLKKKVRKYYEDYQESIGNTASKEELKEVDGLIKGMAN